MDEVIGGVIALDLIVVYLLLTGAAKLYGSKCVHLRIFLASLTAASYSGAVVSGNYVVTGQYFGRMVALIISGVLAFWGSKGAVSKIAIFLLLDSALEGILIGNGLGSPVQRLAVSASIVSICCILRGSSREEQSFSQIIIQYRDKVVRIDAFRDTGNGLIDIVTGAPVLVVGPGTAHHLTGLDKVALADPLKTIEKSPITGLRLIPFSSVGNSHGLILGIRANDVIVDGVSSDMVIGMAPEGLGNYEALIGGNYGTMADRKDPEKIHIFDQFAALHRRLGRASFTVKGQRRAGCTGSPGERR